MGEKGLLLNLVLGVLQRFYTLEDEPPSIVFLVKLSGINIWSVPDLVLFNEK